MKQVIDAYVDFSTTMSTGIASILTPIVGIIIVWYLFGFFFQKSNTLDKGKNTKLLK